MFGLENAYRDRVAQMVEDLEERLEALRRQIKEEESAHESEPS